MFGRNNSADIHAWVEERLSNYIDNQLAASERARLDKHLSGCTQCRASLESIRQTIVLVKQAPAPVSKKSFVLPVPPKRQPSFAFGFASFATALATLLLFAVIGVDLITQSGGGMTASAPMAAKSGANENAAPTQAIALAPQPTPTAPANLLAAPTAVPPSTQAPRAANASSSLAASSSAPLPPAPATAPTRATELTGANAETATAAALDSTKSQAASSSSAARQPVTGASSATVTATATLAPTSTATPVPPTATYAPTLIAQVQTAPTPGQVPLPVETSQPVVSPLRFAEIGLLFLAIFFGVLVVLMRRR